MIQSLSRGLTLIELLGKSNGSRGVTELSRELGVDKSSVTRMLNTLVAHEFAIKDPQSRRYLLGPKLHQLIQQSTNNMPLKQQSMPFIQQLVDETGENAHVGIDAQGRVLVIADIESTAQLRVVSGEGRLIPTYCTALGKCLIAFGDYPLPKALEAFTPRTILSRDQLKLHLAQVRQLGYAVDDEEHEFGVRCIAAPVIDQSGTAVASIGISGPTVRITLERISDLAKIVMRTAAALSGTLAQEAV